MRSSIDRGRYGGKALAVPLWQTYKANLGRVDILKLSLIASVISSVGRNLKLETGGCATSLDSSLRCAALRMTGVKALRSE